MDLKISDFGWKSVFSRPESEHGVDFGRECVAGGYMLFIVLSTKRNEVWQN